MSVKNQEGYFMLNNCYRRKIFIISNVYMKYSLLPLVRLTSLSTNLILILIILSVTSPLKLVMCKISSRYQHRYLISLIIPAMIDYNFA